eukprot:5780034-Ditylum_brightwellii.AAC.1
MLKKKGDDAILTPFMTYWESQQRRNGEVNGTIWLVFDVLGLAPRKHYYRAIKKIPRSSTALKKDGVYHGTCKLHTEDRCLLSTEGKRKIVDGLEFNCDSLYDVTEDVNMMREE